MSGPFTVIRYPDKKTKHKCPLIDPSGRNGMIVECNECGRWWRAVNPGNPEYDLWKRAWVRQFWSGVKH